MARVTLVVDDVGTLDELRDAMALIDMMGFPGESATETPIGGGGLRMQVSADLAELPLARGE